MGLVKLAGTAIKYTGEIIENSDLEDFLMTSGRGILDNYVRKHGVNFVNKLLGRYQKNLVSDLSETINSSGLDLAIKHFVEKTIPKELVKVNSILDFLPVKSGLLNLQSVSFIPKAVVFKYLQREIHASFENSSELNNGSIDKKLITQFLNQIITDYLLEIDQNIATKQGFIQLTGGVSIVASNANQFWGKDRMKGHYYIYSSRISILESEEEALELIEQFEIDFGRFTKHEMDYFFDTSILKLKIQ